MLLLELSLILELINQQINAIKHLLKKFQLKLVFIY